MTKLIKSVADLDGSDELNIPSQLQIDQPADAVVWLQENFGKKYEFADPAQLVVELTSNFARMCREEWSKGVESATQECP